MKHKRRRFIFSNSLHGGNRFYNPIRPTTPEASGNAFTRFNDALNGTDVSYSDTDPEGSWTGVPRDETDEPLQDADDL